jgi:hypothetical protein
MKTIIKVMILLAAVALASCGNDRYEMVTVVNKDGSCTRQLTMHVDSTQLTNGTLDTSKIAVRLDRQWKLTWSTRGSSVRHPFPMTRMQYDLIKTALHGSKQVSDVVTVTAAASWDNAEQMGQNTHFALSGFTITPQAKLTRSFKWFYTDYYYRETYPRQRIAFSVPLTRYLSRDEVGYWFAGRPNLGKGMSGSELDDLMSGIKDKYSKWLCVNFFEWSFDAIVKNYASVTGAPVSKQQFVALHDSLSRYFAKKDGEIKDLDNDQVSQCYREFFHSGAYSAVLDNDDMMAAQQQAVENFMRLSNLQIDYQLVMPGKITNHNDGIVTKGAIKYRLTGDRLLPGDYTLAAQSRVTNTWAFIVTALLIIITVALIVIRKK